MGRPAALIMADDGLMSPGICGRPLPVWLPEFDKSPVFGRENYVAADGLEMTLGGEAMLAHSVVH